MSIIASARSAVLALLAPGLVGALTPATAVAQEPFDVLFLGNSYTQANNLPVLLEQLAASLGRTLVTDRHTPGGNTLGVPQGNGFQHVANPTSLQKIATGGWDAVVLQDQSYMPTIAQVLQTYTQPAVQSLEQDIRAANPTARVVLYMTWGREVGGGPFCLGTWCSPAFADFGAMQASLAAGYEGLAAGATDVEVAPVGLAWQRHLNTPQHADLYAADGSHPSLAGSYLAACVFYARFFDASPVGAAFTAGLSPAEALALQEDAWSTVQAYDCGASTTYDGQFGLELMAGGGVGQLARFRLSGAFGAMPVVALALSAQAAAVPTVGGLLAIDAGALLVGPLLGFPASGASAATFGVSVPNDPAFAGLTVYVQGAAFDSGVLTLSDALRWTTCP